MDNTALSLFMMVGIVAVTGAFLFLASANGSGSASGSLTGYAVSEDAEAQDQATFGIDNVASRPEPTPFQRGATIIFVTFLLSIAAYVYFHPEY